MGKFVKKEFNVQEFNNYTVINVVENSFSDCKSA